MLEECYRMMQNGINICFYGIGSHFDLIEFYLNKYFTEHIQIRIRGFNNGVFMNNITIKILQALDKFGDVDIMVETEKILSSRKLKLSQSLGVIFKLLEKLREYDQYLVLGFHNIDGKNFREIEQHRILSQIAEHSNVKLVASFNHCNFPSFLTKQVLLDYNFCFVSSSFKAPYKKELSFDEISWLNKRELKGAESLNMVSKSLTDNQKDILVLLAKKILDSERAPIEFYSFYETCNSEMLLTEMSQLHTALHEAVDHDIVVVKTNDKGNKILTMPISLDVLKTFVETNKSDEYDF